MITSSPVSRRTPAPSEPGITGSGNRYAGPGGLRTSRSRRLTAAVLSSTTTSPGPATGSGASSKRSSPPSCTRIACIAADPTGPAPYAPDLTSVRLAPPPGSRSASSATWATTGGGTAPAPASDERSSSAQRRPGLLGRDVDGDVAAVRDGRREHDLKLGRLREVVVGAVDDVLVDVDGVAGTELRRLALEPLLDPARLDDDHLVLVGMLVERVVEPGVEADVHHDERGAPGAGRRAAHCRAAPVEALDRHLPGHHEPAHARPPCEEFVP